MFKTTLTFAMALAGLLLLLVPAFSQMDIEFLDDPAFTNDQRPPAVFKHDEHNEIAELFDCAVCHHYYEDGELVEGMDSVGFPCSDCHPAEDPEDSQPTLMQAYHTQCKGCHEEQAKGPITCGECHPRR